MKLVLFFMLRSIPIAILTFSAFSIIRTKYFRHLKKNSNPKREILLSIFATYVVLLMFFLFMPNAAILRAGIDLSGEHLDFVGSFRQRIETGSWGINLVPFKTIKSYIKYSGLFHAILNILGNILIFLPLGILLPAIYKNLRNGFKIFKIAFLTSFFIEFLQFFIGRSSDIDDCILNVSGALIGYIYYKNKRRRFDKKRKYN